MNVLNTKSNVPAVVDHNLNATDIGEMMEANAIAFAATQSAALGETIAFIAKAKQDYEGGPFAVLFKVSGNMTEEQLENLPHPGSDTGNNPAIYKLPNPNAKPGGKAKPITHNYYNTVSDNLSCNIAKRSRIAMLELSLGDPTKVNMSSVPQDIQDMPKGRRDAEISRLKGELLTSRASVNGAFELLFQIRAVNDLPGVTANVLYALDDKGNELDGEDGRDQVVENTRTPIVVTTTLDGRKAIDTVQLSVGSFKRLRPAVALEGGGTYKALMESAPKKGANGAATNEGNASVPARIATLDTFEARLTDIHDYIDDIQSDSKQEVYGALIKKMNRKEGSDDLLVSVTEIRNMFNDLLAKVHNAGPRYQAIITADTSAAA